ncbi:MAG: hypothetical protein OEM82_13615 [Acidobacteriota bacterium]|nr:hypothetical protein [Acidobacteriota bacterium]
MVEPTTQKEQESSPNEQLQGEISDFSNEFGPNDELIASLANAYENRRARQVYEWEIIRRKIYQPPA